MSTYESLFVKGISNEYNKIVSIALVPNTNNIIVATGTQIYIVSGNTIQPLELSLS